MQYRFYRVYSQRNWSYRSSPLLWSLFLAQQFVVQEAWTMSLFVRRSKVACLVVWRTGARLRAGIRKVPVQLRSSLTGPREASQGGWSRQALSAQDGKGPRSSGGCSSPLDGGARVVWSMGTVGSFQAIRSPSRIKIVDWIPSICLTCVREVNPNYKHTLDDKGLCGEGSPFPVCGVSFSLPFRDGRTTADVGGADGRARASRWCQLS